MKIAKLSTGRFSPVVSHTLTLFLAHHTLRILFYSLDHHSPVCVRLWSKLTNVFTLSTLLLFKERD
jgi:hypothetical protein